MGATLTDQETAEARDRRREHREQVIGDLWLIDPQSQGLIRAHCVDVSSSGMRLRVPLGHGIHEGQRYQLCSHRPGQTSPPGLGLLISRGGVIVRSRMMIGDRDEVEIGVALDPTGYAQRHRPADEYVIG